LFPVRKLGPDTKSVVYRVVVVGGLSHLGECIKMWEWLSKALDWIIDAIKDVFEWVFAQVLNALASILEQLPVPEFLTNGQNLFASVSGAIGWLWQYFEVPYGVGVMVAAWGLRFLIRRIPIFG
jgi:hypothetical protein